MLDKVSGEGNQEAYIMASTPTRDLPEEFLAATRKSQEVMIRAIRTWVETVRTVTPKLPTVPGPLANRLPRLPSVAAPFADRLPTPEDVVASGYDFAEQLLAIQRKFAEDVLAATEPLIPGHGKRAWQDATRTDATIAAKQTTAAAKQTAAAAKTAVTGTVQAAEPAAPKAASPKSTAPKSTAPKSTAPESDRKPAAPRHAPRSTGTR
jgi:septal ring-binding cell division protein DamX